MPAHNLFLVEVRDAEAATTFYGALFDIEPVFTSPRYVASRWHRQSCSPCGRAARGAQPRTPRAPAKWGS